jgi:hypothetical protein
LLSCPNTLATAAEALERIGSSHEFEALLESTRPNLHPQSRWVTAFLAIVTASNCGLCVLLVVWLALTHFRVACFVLAQTAVLSIIAAHSGARVGIRRYQSLSRALAVLENPRAAGVLAVGYRDADLRRFITPALRAGLNGATDDIVKTFTDQHRAAIIRLLETDDPMLVQGAAMAVGKFGGAEAVAPLERAARRQFHPSTWLKAARAGFGDPAAAVETYRKVTEEALAVVRARAEHARDAATLLRAAGGANAIAAEQLLRPAAGDAEAEHQQLLRRIDEGEELRGGEQGHEGA